LLRAVKEEEELNEPEVTAKRWLEELAVWKENRFERERNVEIVRAGTRILNRRLEKAREKLRDEPLLREGVEVGRFAKELKRIGKRQSHSIV
jgi:hypothetical protein